MSTATHQQAQTVSSPLLPRVRQPSDLRCLTRAQLGQLAAEIREFLVKTVAANGGHLGPNLGMVEITIALHRVFESPQDMILFDTGHQAYVHKIITGRRETLTTLRQPGGVSGYPCRAESPHDHIENSHASTALAYADGIAKALKIRGHGNRAVVAVVGDGALTGGMAWEALNNLGMAQDRPVVIVLNDNGRSYQPTVGGLAVHLAALRSRLATGNVFRDLGFAYIGPVDGHDEPAVEHALIKARGLGRPVIVHCVTRKGHGYRPAEFDEADHMHTVGVINPGTGVPATPSARAWTDVFSEEICALGEQRPDLICITAAMAGPTGLTRFAQRFPDRLYDVGIAEQHAVASAAGLAMAGMRPLVALYATFLNRAVDQVLMDVALHRLPVTFVLDRAGITGPDGPSHHGMWDLSVLGMVPDMRIAAPRDPARLRELLHEALDVDDGPTALRFPKATEGPDIPAAERRAMLDILMPDETGQVLLVAVGTTANPCLDASNSLRKRGIGATVVDPRWVSPVSTALISLAAQHRLVVTVEDNVRTGGAGMAIAQACADAGVSAAVKTIGLSRQFIPHGKRPDLLAERGIASAAIADTVIRQLPEVTDDFPGWENAC